MVGANNSNSHIGKNVEALFKNSVGDHPSVIKTLQDLFKIEGRFITAITTGLEGEKADVKMNFACGRNIDVNVKSYKKASAFNQLTRSSVTRFCKLFDVNDSDKDSLENIVVEKSKNVGNPLFSEIDSDKWKSFFESHAYDILKWCFSYKPSREILVLFCRDDFKMRIYPMKSVLNTLPKKITFTKGGFNIGQCVSFQRKGGNGKLSKSIPKHSINHPGNNIQLKLKIKKFIMLMESVKIDEYSI